jgi:hypothetical protein
MDVHKPAYSTRRTLLPATHVGLYGACLAAVQACTVLACKQYDGLIFYGHWFKYGCILRL